MIRGIPKEGWKPAAGDTPHDAPNLVMIRGIPKEGWKPLAGDGHDGVDLVMIRGIPKEGWKPAQNLRRRANQAAPQ